MGVSTANTYDLGLDGGVCGQARRMIVLTQISGNPELFSHVLHFFGATDLLPIMGGVIFLPAAFSTTFLETYRPSGEQQSSTKGHFFVGDVVIVLCSLARNETFYI